MLRTVMINLLFSVAGTALSLSTISAAESTGPVWQPDAVIAVPGANTAYMAPGKNDCLIVTSVNNTPNAGPASAYRITNPDSASPVVTPFATRMFPAYRGYTGVACDSEGNIYLSADGGKSNASILVRYAPWLIQDEEFGVGGQISSDNDRYQGVAIDGEHLVVLTNWSRLSFFTLEGKPAGSTAQLADPKTGPTLRDIALVSSTHDIIAITGEQIYRFYGGSAANPAGYRLTMIRSGRQREAIGQGIYYDSVSGKMYFPQADSRSLVAASLSDASANASGDSATLTGSELQAIADSVISVDHKNLYVSDLHTKGIVRFRKTQSAGQVPVATAPAPAASLPPVAAIGSPAPESAQPSWRDRPQRLVAMSGEVIESPTQTSSITSPATDEAPPAATGSATYDDIPPAPGGNLLPIGGTPIFRNP